LVETSACSNIVPVARIGSIRMVRTGFRRALLAGVLALFFSPGGWAAQAPPAGASSSLRYPFDGVLRFLAPQARAAPQPARHATAARRTYAARRATARVFHAGPALGGYSYPVYPPYPVYRTVRRAIPAYGPVDYPRVVIRGYPRYGYPVVAVYPGYAYRAYGYVYYYYPYGYPGY